MGKGKPAKQQVRLCGGVERMVELISRSEDKSLAHIQPVLFDSLSCLAFHSIETKGIILSMGGTNQILKMISNRKSEKSPKTILTAIKLIKILSTDDQNKSELIG